jgi:hypothetical protein
MAGVHVQIICDTLIAAGGPGKGPMLPLPARLTAIEPRCHTILNSTPLHEDWTH